MGKNKYHFEVLLTRAGFKARECSRGSRWPRNTSVMLNSPTSCRSPNISLSTWKSPLNKITFFLSLWHGPWDRAPFRAKPSMFLGVLTAVIQGLKCVRPADLERAGPAEWSWDCTSITKLISFSSFFTHVTAAGRGPRSAVCLPTYATIELIAPSAGEWRGAGLLSAI